MATPIELKDSAVRAFREIALKAVDEKTNAIKAEYSVALEKASKDLDKRIEDLSLLVSKGAHKDVDENVELRAKRKSQADNFKAIIKGLKHNMINEDLVRKSDAYVRFDAESAGNLLMAPELSREINRKLIEISPVLSVVNVVNIGGPKLSDINQTSNIQSAWEDEEFATPLATPEMFKDNGLTPFKLKVRVKYTEEMLQDSAFDIEAFTNTSVEKEFRRKIGNATLQGNGVKRPTGMVANLQSIDSTSLTLAPSHIISLQNSVIDEYLGADPSSVGWMLTRKTRASVRALAITNGSQLFWEIDGRAGNPERLLGYPIFIAAESDLDNGNAAGVFTAGQKPIGFGNFKQAYTVAIREGMNILRDPYTGAAEDAIYVTFRQRVDGKPINLEAAKFLKMTSS
jgi:HK97 family phage major capsid protein